MSTSPEALSPPRIHPRRRRARRREGIACDSHSVNFARFASVELRPAA
jgi:hypothetical protein